MVLLGERNRVARADERDLGTACEVKRIHRAQRVGVESAVHTDESDMRRKVRTAAEFVVLVESLTVAQRDDERVFGLTE